MKEWLFRVAARKAAYGAAKALATFILSAKAVSFETALGLHVDPTTFQLGCGALILGGIEWVHDYLKLKFPNTSWL